MFKYFHVFLFLACGFNLFCQTDYAPLSTYIEKITEHLVSSTYEDIPVESLTEDLEELYLHPLDLNKVSMQDLEKLWILNEFQVKSLLSYRHTMHQFISVHEVSYIYGFNQQIFELIEPFIQVNAEPEYDTIEMKKIVHKSDFEYLARTAYKTHNPSKYDGLPFDLFTRFTMNYADKVKFGILAENDAGEYFMHDHNKNGFDFYSGYLQINTNTFLKSITLGDFKVQAGQGLLIWNGFSSGKSTDLYSVMKRRQGISVNKSKNEYDFQRGAGMLFALKHLNLYVYGSIKKTDAILDTASGEAMIKNLSTTGYHRTISENLRKHNNTELSGGMLLSYQTERTHIGFNWVRVSSAYPFLKDTTDFKLNRQEKIYQGTSIDYKLLLDKYHLFGELATIRNSIAAIAGINLLFTSNLSALVLYRNYSSDYYSPYAKAFGENGSIENEKGLYAGIHWQASKFIEISTSTDVFTIPWYSYNTDNSSNGTENMLEIKLTPSKATQLKVRYKYKGKEKNYTDEIQPTHQVESFYRQNFRFHLTTELSSEISMNNRLEICRAGFQGMQHSTGFLVYHDLLCRLSRRARFTLRYAFYDIADYNTRIYAYEHDVLYGFSMPAYYGNGQKIYLLVHYKINKCSTVWLRYDLTHPFEKTGSICHGLKIQIRYRF